MSAVMIAKLKMLDEVMAEYAKALQAVEDQNAPAAEPFRCGGRRESASRHAGPPASCSRSCRLSSNRTSTSSGTRGAKLTKMI